MLIKCIRFYANFPCVQRYWCFLFIVGGHFVTNCMALYIIRLIPKMVCTSWLAFRCAPSTLNPKQWKKGFEKKTNPLPLLPHVKWRREKKKHLFVPLFSFKSKRNLKNHMYRRTPSPWTMNKYNKIIPLAILNNKK